ncbi:MAG: protein-L-isoaspartate(D-aspartate) O-methyltransferase [Alphaproteobacteria bacterium]|nr:protein-L-isoaspartate(D-aspartate) O-methyltransferase [Alphaproteobacteria bacterium]
MSLEERRVKLLLELRREGISDDRVLAAIEAVPREAFVMPAFADQAYDNIPLPIEEGQTISQPFIVAYMSQALRLEPKMRVLEIGTGSGYQAAVLARLARRVYTIERHRPLLERAKARFEALGLHNIVTRLGDGSKGWPEQAPIERILVTAAAGQGVPAALLDQLDTGGILVIPVGASLFEQRILRVTRTASGFEEEEMLPVRFVPLVEEPPPPQRRS